MADHWETVAAIVTASAGVISCLAAVVAVTLSVFAIRSVVRKERRKLANGVVGDIEGNTVVIYNFTDQVIVNLEVSVTAGIDDLEVTMDRAYIPPNARITGTLPVAATGASRESLVYEFKDSREDTWRRRWSSTERL